MRYPKKLRAVIFTLACLLLVFNINVFFNIKADTTIELTEGIRKRSNKLDDADEPDFNLNIWFESPESKMLREKLVYLLNHGAQYKSILTDYYLNETGYNEAYIDTLPFLRHIPENMTHKLEFCDNQTYRNVAPAKISVVTHYFNEPLSLVLRTIYSCLIHTPPEYLHEIVVLDDGSTRPDETGMFVPLFRSLYPYVRYVRNEVPTGLVPARRQVLTMATGEYVFLVDSHSEFHKRWYLPLLNITQSDYKSVAAPVIDLFYHYLPKLLFYDGVRVDMDIFLSWRSSPYRGKGEPYHSGAIMGGAYMIARRRLVELDYFGRGFKGYGGENMEVGLKTWSCGGKVWIVPCSRILHYTAKRQPVGLKGRPTKPFTHYNSRILGESFFDDERILKIARIGWHQQGDVDESAIEFNKKLVEKLNCGGTRNFFKEIMPSIEIFDDDDCIGYKMAVNHKCLRFHLDRQVGKGIVTLAETCSEVYDHEIYNHVRMTSRGDIRVQGYLCLDPGLSKDPLSVRFCSLQKGNQEFRYDPIQSKMFWRNSGLCLDINDEQQLSISPCNKPDLAKVNFIYKNYSEALRRKGIIS